MNLLNFSFKFYLLMLMAQYFINFKTFYRINYWIYFIIVINFILITICWHVFINCSIFSISIFFNLMIDLLYQGIKY